MEYKFKELRLEDLDTLIKKFIVYHNGEGGNWTCDLAKRNLKQTLLTPDYYGVGLYEKSELIG